MFVHIYNNKIYEKLLQTNKQFEKKKQTLKNINTSTINNLVSTFIF